LAGNGSHLNGVDGELKVEDWTDVTVGLLKERTVLAAGNNSYVECNVGNLTGIVDITATHYNTGGLKDDGTVLIIGDNPYGQCDVDTLNAPVPTTRANA
jgi:hypothetical protein